jgi:histidinol dehydrogenase
MHCSVNGGEPPPGDIAAWERLVVKAARGGKLRLVQIYGKARSSPHDPLCRALPLEALEVRADSLRRALSTAGVEAPVEVYE